MAYPDRLHRGGYCVYRKEPKVLLKIESEPFQFSGQTCIQARMMAKRKADQQQGLYAVEALLPPPEEE